MNPLSDMRDIVILEGEYSISIVILSVFIAIVASYTALIMNEKMKKNGFFHQNFWLTLASLAMGFGIWSMHFIGMSAFMLHVEMEYDIMLTVLSVLPAIFASFLAFYISNRKNNSIWPYVVAGIIMGIGISGMHYTGMLAMKMDVDFIYDPILFIVSILIAIVVSFVALYIFSRNISFLSNVFVRGVTAVIMGLAISSMHYTGMNAVIFYVNEDNVPNISHLHQMDITLLVVSITIGISILLAVSGLSGILDKYVEYRLNYFDALTKLPNRRQFEKTIKDTNAPSMLFILHLHNLERLNSGYGYEMGDEIIKTVGELLSRLKPDSAELYRIEGNRFAVFTRVQNDFSELRTSMERISSILMNPVVVNEQRIILESVSALDYSTTEIDVNQLFLHVMSVLHHPSITFNHEIVEYDPAIHTYSFERGLLDDIDRAMREHELYLVYQPKVSSNKKEIIGVEALLRWNHPVHGPLSPAVFIPILEESGKMYDVTDWVIDQVCIRIATTIETGLPVWQVAINIPGPYITSERLVRTLKESVRRHHISPQYIELEMTETSVVSNIDNAISSVKELRELGFSVALDDFGTGVSSLSYLKRLPISTLKIDKSFVDGVPSSSKDSAIIKAIITLCHSLNLHVVIEGVEFEEQIDYLSSMPETLTVQGYYYSRPLKYEDLLEWESSFSKRKKSKIIYNKF
ncbi:EAL domain-containing protein [Bacillus sp. BGMRC 2118]|nr:EAL domain-containing protein [Bacillus sp. BGMRC 2118]